MLKDLTIDPATGLPNLFGLLEAAQAGKFGSEGAVVAADIANLSVINRQHGLKTGDACVRCLSGLLRAETNSRAGAGMAFRISGDEFITVLPGADEAAAMALVDRVSEKYRQRMLVHNVHNAALHTAVYAYADGEASAVSVLRVTYVALEGCHAAGDVPAFLPGWAEHLIQHMIERTCETLRLLREARTIALTDKISGLPNHRAAELLLAHFIEEYEAHGEPFGVWR